MDFKEFHSFAVMAYGESPYLEECIQSVLNQAEKSTVYISTSTPSEYIDKIAEKYAVPVKINQNKPSLATDWQFALDNCETPLVTLAHQDDIYYPGYSKVLSDAIKRRDGIIAFCAYEEIVGDMVRKNTTFLKIKKWLLWPYLFKKSLKSRFAKRFILRFGNSVCCPSVMFNIGKHKITFDPSYKNDLDWDAWLRLSDYSGSFVYIKQTLIAHRIHEDSETTRQIANNSRYLEDRQIYERLWPKSIARLLASFYKRGYLSNDIKKR